MKVLFVCTGNLCRSPMAEALLRHALTERGCGDVEIVSAGTWGGLGNRATVDAVDALAARGIDLSQHRSRALERVEVEDADVVVGMTSVHRREILELVPEAEGKLVLMKELAEIEPVEAGTRLHGLLAGTRPAWRRELDVDDPMGLPLTAYQRCVAELERGVTVLAEALCG